MKKVDLPVAQIVAGSDNLQLARTLRRQQRLLGAPEPANDSTDIRAQRSAQQRVTLGRAAALRFEHGGDDGFDHLSHAAGIDGVLHRRCS